MNSDVGDQLLRLGAGQYHAEVECMQKAPLRQPTTALYQFLVQDGDLPRRPTKADEPELEPKPKGFGHADGVGRL
jgi:hypothetical protein